MEIKTLLYLSPILLMTIVSLVVWAIKVRESRIQANFDKLFAQSQRIENSLIGITKDVGSNSGRIEQIEKRVNKHGAELMSQRESNAVLANEIKHLHRDS